jgi:hypothetical protein
MRTVVSISNILLFTGLLAIKTGLTFAQEYKPYNTFNKEAELKKFVEQGGKVEEISPNIYNQTYRTGESITFYLGNKENVNDSNKLIDPTIINVWEIDTTLYAHKFKFWQRVDIVNNYEGIVPIEDLNHNGLLELYGFNEYVGVYVGPVLIFEQDNTEIFNQVYTYDSNSVFVQGIGDIDSDGEKEIYLRTIDTLNGKFYRADSVGTLPTTFDFIFYYYPYPGDIKDMTFGDFDKNGITNCAFISSAGPAVSVIIIGEFRDSINNFSTVYEQVTSDTTTVNVPAGFAISDFDNDNKAELIAGSTQGFVYSIEVVKENLYELVWQGLAPTHNAYMIASTNDIDGNGKPEFWIGGQDFGTGISTFWCYESDGDNSYIPVAEIQLRYLVSLYTDYLQSADIDNDGKEELIISLGNYLLILKFTGKPNQHSYEIFYAKIDELSQPGAEFLPVTIADLNKDGKKDILLQMYKYINPNTDFFSYLLVQDTVTSVQDDNAQTPDKFDLLQNYPNPFNPSTQIKVIISEQSNVKVVVYDILGKEITTVLDENLSAGEYTIQWNGEDNKGNYLAGGIYFIQMKANGFNKTIKAILLK